MYENNIILYIFSLYIVNTIGIITIGIIVDMYTYMVSVTLLFGVNSF